MRVTTYVLIMKLEKDRLCLLLYLLYGVLVVYAMYRATCIVQQCIFYKYCPDLLCL